MQGKTIITLRIDLILWKMQVKYFKSRFWRKVPLFNVIYECYWTHLIHAIFDFFKLLHKSYVDSKYVGYKTAPGIKIGSVISVTVIYVTFSSISHVNYIYGKIEIW